MKKCNKLLFLCSAGLLALSVASCTKTVARNTSVPLSNLDTSAIIAKSGDFSITNDFYYTRLRYKGYSTVLNEIKKDLYTEEYAFVKSQIDLTDNEVTEYEQDLFDSYASDIYGSSSVSTLKDLEEKDRDVMIQKYIDSSSNKGIFVTKENCLNYSFVDEKIKFGYIPQEVIDEKLLTLAMNKAAKDALEKIVDEEKITDDDNKLVANSNYISESDLSNKYESAQMSYGTYRAIVIQFNNLSEARKVIAAVEAKVGSLTQANALSFYVNLYNTYYNYRTPLSETNPFENSSEDSKTVFVVNKDKNELSELSSSISNLVRNTLEEDGQYIERPFNQNSKYVMIYRGATEYELNKKYNITPYNEPVEWNDLKDHAEAFETVKAEVRDDLIKNKISSYSTTVLNKRIKNSEIEIYDPYFENQFKNSYSDDYELISPNKFNNDLIYKLSYTDPDTKATITADYSVYDFYITQSRISGLDVVVEKFKFDYVYEFKDILLTSDQINDIEDDLNKSINTFNKNENAAYPSNMGLELYLLSAYGYSNREDVLKYNKLASNSLLNKYLNQNVFDEWAKKLEDETYSHELDTTKLNILNNLLKAGNDNYASLFSINIDHILIYIDDDGDGSPDDPKDFVKNFSETQKQEFNAALLDLANAIYDESTFNESIYDKLSAEDKAKYKSLIDSNSILDILKYIVGAYNRNEKLFSHPDKTWEDYKKYNFLLTAESLSSSGDTTQSNVGNYVKEFGDYVKKLYSKAVENKLVVDSKKSVFYFVESGTKAPSKNEDLCATQFGYHMIVVNSYDTPSTTKSTSSSDTYGYYKDIEILLNEKESDTTEDNIYVVIPDTYNEEEKTATMNQFFVYYVQKQKSATSSLDSTLRDVLSSMFDDAITRYTSSGFQNFLLFKDLNITATDSNSTLARQLENYEGYLKRTSQSYDNEDSFNSWYSGELDWSRPYNK